jgi:hypothetical protein
MNKSLQIAFSIGKGILGRDLSFKSHYDERGVRVCFCCAGDWLELLQTQH